MTRAEERPPADDWIAVAAAWHIALTPERLLELRPALERLQQTLLSIRRIPVTSETPVNLASPQR